MALAFLAITFLYTWSLNRTGVITPDEPRYAAIAKQMASSGDYISPILWGEAWFEKPPLLYWLSAAGFKLGLPGELALRLPIALFSIFFLIFYYKALSTILGSRDTAQVATTMLATTVFWFAFSQVAVTDLPLAATFTGTLLAIVAGWRWWATLMFGLALLAKGGVAPVLLLPTVWLHRRDWRNWIVPATASLAVAAIWYVPITLKYGQPFWQVFFIEHHLGRFSKSALQHVQGPLFYIPVILGAMVPWAPFLFDLRAVRQVGATIKPFVWTVVWGLLFFSVSTNKLPGYVLPLVPSLCVWGAVSYQKSQQKRLLLSLSLVSLMLVLVASQLLPNALNSGISRQSLQSLSVPWGAAPLAILLLRPSFGAVAAAAFLCFAWVQETSVDQVNALASARPVWQLMKDNSAGQCVNGNVSRSIRYGLNYYANRTLPDCEVSEKPND